MLPIWAQKDPKKYTKRIAWENDRLMTYFPTFSMLQEHDGNLSVVGSLITDSQNIYNVKIFYPSKYPYEPPVPIVTDKDVIEHCKKFDIHQYHNYGEFQGGLNVCVIKPNDKIGTGWSPDLSVIFMIPLVSAWLHAYEVKKETGVWILPEA